MGVDAVLEHFFECSEHLDAALTALAARKVPLKFAYAGSAARTHSLLAKSAGYQHVNWPIAAETAAARELALGRKLRLLEFGPGTGHHTAHLLAELVGQLDTQRYIGIDFARGLFMGAARLIRQAAPGVLVTFACCDLEAEPALLPDPPQDSFTMFLVLGGLLANVESPERTAQNIRASLETGDVGLISVPGYKDGTSAEDYVAPYRSISFRNAALEPLRAMGLKVEDDQFSVQWDDAARAVVASIAVNIDGERQEIQCFTSRRFIPDRFEAVLAAAGLGVSQLSVSGDGTLIWSVFAQ